MSDTSENMILRTVYLPRELDQKLKAASIRGGRSKGDIVRDMISAGLSALDSVAQKPDKPQAVIVRPVTARKAATGLSQRKSAKPRLRRAATKA